MEKIGTVSGGDTGTVAEEKSLSEGWRWVGYSLIVALTPIFFNLLVTVGKGAFSLADFLHNGELDAIPIIVYGEGLK